MMLKSTELAAQKAKLIAELDAQIKASVEAERKEALDDIRAKCRYFKVTYRELKAHLVRTPDAKNKKPKTRTKKQKFDVYGEQPVVKSKKSGV